MNTLPKLRRVRQPDQSKPTTAAGRWFARRFAVPPAFADALGKAAGLGGLDQ
jgi:hypothetical protein